MALPLILARSFREAHAFAKERLDLRVGHYRVVNDAGTIKAVRGTQLYLVPGWDKRPDRFKMQGAIRYCRLEIVDIAEQDKASAPAPVDPVPTPGQVAEAIANGTASSLVIPNDPAGTDFFDGVDVPPLAPEDPEPTATCVECGLTPCSDDCPTSNTLETEGDEPYVDETGFIRSAPADLEAALEPEGWEPPESLDAEQVLRLAAGESGADVAPMEDRSIPTVVSDEAEELATEAPEPPNDGIEADDTKTVTPEPAEKPKARRRSKCKKCGVLHYKDEPCPSDGE